MNCYLRSNKSKTYTKKKFVFFVKCQISQLVFSVQIFTINAEFFSYIFQNENIFLFQLPVLSFSVFCFFFDFFKRKFGFEILIPNILSRFARIARNIITNRRSSAISVFLRVQFNDHFFKNRYRLPLKE